MCLPSQPQLVPGNGGEHFKDTASERPELLIQLAILRTQSHQEETQEGPGHFSLRPAHPSSPLGTQPNHNHDGY